MADRHEAFRSGAHPEEIERFVPAGGDKLNKRRGRRNTREPRLVTILAIHPGDKAVLKTSPDLKRVK